MRGNVAFRPGSAADPARVPTIVPMDWTGTLVTEGVETGDGRFITPGALDWRELPLPLRWTPKDEGGHFGAVVVGRIDTISRNGDLIDATGVLDADGEHGAEVVRLMGLDMLAGVSVDLDAMEVEPYDMMDPDDVLRVTSAKIAAATIVDTPAFEGARIELVGPVPVPTAAVDLSRFEVTADQLERTIVANGEAWVSWLADEDVSVGTVVEIGDAAATVQPKMVEGDGWVDDGDPVSVAFEELTMLDGPPDIEEPEAEPEDAPPAGPPDLSLVVTADGAPVFPPAAWFTADLDGPTPMTVDDNGRVYGHLALWGTCHIGRPNCLQPPTSETGYAMFHTGCVRTSTGDDLATGVLTVDTGHAPLSAPTRNVSVHYDDTGHAIADVRVGEDEYGIWFAGCLRSSATDEQIRVLRGSSISGDWRSIGSGLELVAALAVNVPGFPVPRASITASGATTSLVAAGANFDAAAVPARAAHPTSLTPVVNKLARTIGADEETRIAALTARAGEPMLAAVLDLNRRVKG